jgi:hypothetical protein
MMLAPITQAISPGQTAEDGVGISLAGVADTRRMTAVSHRR